MHIQTPRLLIRTVTEADVPALVTLWSDPVATQFLGGPRPVPYLQETFSADAASGQPDPFDLWPIVLRASGAVIGQCGLLEKEIEGRPEIEVTYILIPKVWGQGYATEAVITLRDYACQELHVPRLAALIAAKNQPSARVARKAGFDYVAEVIRPGGHRRELYRYQVSAHEPGQN
jgi:ribosomal-protein-alanine N-acetyltransferase